MIIIDVPLKFKKGQLTAEMLSTGCWHIGNPSYSESGIETFLDMAQTRPWWHKGDMIEAITTDDKRHQAGEHSDSVLSTAQVASAHVSSAAKTCVGTICGNHEYGGSGKIGSLAEMIAHQAKVRYLGMTAYFKVKCPKGECLVFTAHGAGSMGFNSGFPERDQVNRELKLRRILKPFQADLKSVAHYHRTIIAPKVVQYRGTVEDGVFKRRAISDESCWCDATASLFRNYHADSQGSYAEMKLYAPTDIGWSGYVFNRDGSIACIREYNSDGDIIQEVEEKRVR